MHREISHIDGTFRRESHAGLYFLTGLIGLLLGLDLLWPLLAQWLNAQLSWNLPTLEKGMSLFGGNYSFALAAAILGGVRIVVTSLEGLLAGKLGADLALAIAMIAAILMNQPLVAAEVVFIGLIGECLEAITFDRTQRAIRRLVEVCPRMCLVIRDGQESKIPVGDLKAGERVVVRPGKRVPVDGVVIDGRSAVDQSALTGESLPLDKTNGDEVFAGTLNQHGALIVEVRRIAEHTVMGRVIELTARALRDKAGLERTADRMARFFLPVVLGLAAITFLANLWWFRATAGAVYQAAFPALAILVVACPCALILATPAAIIAAMGRLAGTGVLIKGGAALERLAKVDAFAFDKTGTLTQGRLQLGDIMPLDPACSEDELLRLAATAEQRSEHLLGELIVAEARKRRLELPAIQEFQAFPGAGVVALTEVAHDTVVVGNHRYFDEQHIAMPAEALAALATLDRTGQTALFIAKNAKVLGVIGATDSPRTEAFNVLRELERAGIRHFALLTGDRAAAAAEIASRLELRDVHAELLPAQKADFIEKWRSEGRRVAMVGDGINDAPALAKADVGLALGGVGSDIAAEAGDFVLMGDPLRPLPLLLRLSRKTVEIIRQNILYFAFGVNIVGIILTAWILPAWSESARKQAPIWAAVYHQIGSLAVLLNAMRLLWFERGQDFAVSRRMQSVSQSVDRWIERLDFHEFTHWVLDHGRKLLLGGTAVILLLYGLSGITIVQPNEIGIVQRFGRPLQDDLSPGFHWQLPWPCDRVTKIRPDELRSVEVGFRTVGPDAGTLTWSSIHADGIAKDKEEALMMTGDGNVVEVQVSVFYTIAEPRIYLFEVVQPEAALRAIAESVLRDVMAERPFIALLTNQREAFQKEVVARLTARCRDDYRLGIELRSVAFQDLHPPQEVVDSYYDVTRALTQRERVVTEARTKKETDISREEVAAQRLKATAAAGYYDATEKAAAERDAFLSLAATQRVAWLNGFAVPNPLTGPVGLVTGLLVAESQRPGDSLPQELTEFRLHIEAAEQLLAGRPKVLRDPALKGQLHVMPDLLKFRIPLIGRDREVQPPRRPSNDGP